MQLIWPDRQLSCISAHRLICIYRVKGGGQKTMRDSVASMGFSGTPWHTPEGNSKAADLQLYECNHNRPSVISERGKGFVTWYCKGVWVDIIFIALGDIFFIGLDIDMVLEVNLRLTWAY